MASSTSARDARQSAGSYHERLFVPLRWWVQATMLLASLWLAFIVAMPAAAAWAATGVLVLITFGGFVWLGNARVEVRDGVLYAGPVPAPRASASSRGCRVEISQYGVRSSGSCTSTFTARFR